MAKRSYKPEEIVAKLRQVDVLNSQGMPMADAIRQVGVSEVTFYRWRKEFDDRAHSVNAVHLKHVLGDIQTDCANLSHGWLLLGGSTDRHRNVAHRDAGGGAVNSTIF